MKASCNTLNPVAGRARWAVVIALALTTLAGLTGCDTVDIATLASWGGLVNGGYTSSLGLPENPTSYWGALGYGTQNVDSWGGLASAGYTSSLGLPVYPASWW